MSTFSFIIKIIVIISLFSLVFCKENALVNFENNIENKIGDFTVSVVRFLEDFNDRHIGKSEWGKYIGYENMKPTLEVENGRGLKKMSMSMMPLIFHVGATSTWMMLTSIMAAKSVAIGLLLLVFKIAVSSAKIASFFTLLKSKASNHDHGWSSHDHSRSLTKMDLPIHHGWDSYVPELTLSDPITGYKTLPNYKEHSVAPFEDVDFESPKFEERHS